MKNKTLSSILLATLFAVLISCGGRDTDASKSPDTVRVDSTSINSDSIVNPNEVDKEGDEDNDATVNTEDANPNLPQD